MQINKSFNSNNKVSFGRIVPKAAETATLDVLTKNFTNVTVPVTNPKNIKLIPDSGFVELIKDYVSGKKKAMDLLNTLRWENKYTDNQENVKYLMEYIEKSADKLTKTSKDILCDTVRNFYQRYIARYDFANTEGKVKIEKLFAEIAQFGKRNPINF